MSHRTSPDQQPLLGAGSQRSYSSLLPHNTNASSPLASIHESEVFPSPPAADPPQALLPPVITFQRIPPSRCWQRLLEWAPHDPHGQALWRWLHSLLQQEQTGLSHWVWQLSLSGALLHDWIEYARAPEMRFGNTLGHVLSGWASDPNAVGTHWGSDRPSEGWFWAAPAALLLLVGISMVRACGLGGLRCSPTEASLEYRRALEHFEQDVSSVLPYVWRADLAADGAYLRDPRCSMEDRQRILNQLAITSNEGAFGLRHRAIGQLIVFLRHQLIEDAATPNVALAQHIQATNWTHQVSAHVQFHRQSRRVTHRGWARYQLWRQGVMTTERGPLPNKARIFWGAVPGLIFLWRQFVRYHYWRLLITKLWQVIATTQQQQACETSHRHWFYVSLLDQAVCAICPDWPFVPLAVVDDPQACLNGLLRQPLPPRVLAEQLARLRFHPNVSQLDLSHQPWAYGWRLEDLSAVLEALELIWTQPQASPLQRLDLSNALGGDGVMAPSQLRRLARFMNTVSALEVRLRHYTWGRPAWEVLNPVWVNGTGVLDVSFSDWGDAGLRHWLSGKGLPVCERLHAEHSQLTDASLHALSARWGNLTLTELKLGGNAFSAEGVLAWAEHLMARSLHTLDLSEVLLVPSVTQRLWPLLQTVAHLRLHGCGLTDRALLGLERILPNTRWVALDVSDNPFTDEAMMRLAQGLRDCRLQQLNVSYTGLSIMGLERLGRVLGQMDALVRLDVSGCFVAAGTDDFFAGVVHSRLRHLGLNGVRLNEPGLQALGWHWHRAENVSLQEVRLADNAFSSTAMRHWLQRIQPHSRCQRLDLSGNGLNDEVLSALGALSSLQSLDLTHNAITDLGLLPAGDVLEVLHVSHNPLVDAGVLAWVRAGLPPMPYFERLGACPWSLRRAERRDFAQHQFLGALHTLEVAHVPFEAPVMRTLCRVSQSTGLTLSRLGDEADFLCQRSDAARVGVPAGLHWVSGLCHGTLHAVGAWASHTLTQAPGRSQHGGSLGFFAPTPARSTMGLDVFSLWLGCLCVLSVWWLCGRPYRRVASMWQASKIASIPTDPSLTLSREDLPDSSSFAKERRAVGAVSFNSTP